MYYFFKKILILLLPINQQKVFICYAEACTKRDFILQGTL